MPNGVKVEAELSRRLCRIGGVSGAGKTYFLRIMCDYAELSGLSWVYLHYRSVGMSEQAILESVGGKDIVACDDADLYLTKDLLHKIVQSTEGLILVVYRTSNLLMADIEEGCICYANYSRGSLIVKSRDF